MQLDPDHLRQPPFWNKVYWPKFQRKQIFISKRLDSMFGRALVRGWRPFMNQVLYPTDSQGTRLTGLIKSLERGELFRRFHLQNRQNAKEIDSAGANLSLELDCQANQLNQTNVFPATTTLKRKAASSEHEQTIVLCLRACSATK